MVSHDRSNRRRFRGFGLAALIVTGIALLVFRHLSIEYYESKQILEDIGVKNVELVSWFGSAYQGDVGTCSVTMKIRDDAIVFEMDGEHITSIPRDNAWPLEADGGFIQKDCF